MKNIKILFSFLLMLAVTISCSVPEGIDGDTSFLNSASDPAAVSALATITQDNTGKVTLTPRGEGATKFEVYFGDGTAQPAIVTAGGSVVHIYREGIYSVKVIAFGITGKKTESTQQINVSFRSPENLVVTIENDRAISKKVTVKATADFALFYEVYFGDVTNEVPVQVNNGESTSHVYANAGTYKIKIVSKSGAIRPTLYEQDFVVTAIMAPIASATTPPVRITGDVISIFSSRYTNLANTNFYPNWGQSTQFAEFDLAGDKMLQYSNLNYQGVEFATTDLTNMQYLHMDVWTANLSALETFLISRATGEKSIVKTLTANAWTSIDIPLADFVAKGMSINDIFQFKFVGATAGTVFIDNIYFYKDPSATMVLPINFESTTLTYNWIGFGNAGYGPIPTAVITNPDRRGSNTTAKVLKVTKTVGSQVWAGASQDLDSRINFSAGTKIKVAVWSPLANSTILLKLEDLSSPRDGNGNPTRFVEVQARTTTSNAWEILTFDLTTANSFNSSISYDKIVLFPDFGVSNSSELIYYFDEIIQSN
jgi:hypothetical protein